ncbi:single-stranded DNA-binding protein [Streptomyces sp. NPDC048172]|uniref:single-stranded DNA-binding protein n=1 Tax=Streptomyces sp. NPDC048172 TaxID=3365505 RepID=UPI0037109C31
MNESHVTVVGNVATPVDYRVAASGVPVARFRLASTVRRFDQQSRSWADAFTSFFTVWAWRTLATNIASSVSRGEPVIVQGQLRVQENERDGKRYVSADLTASSVGHDLSRGTTAFVRVSQAKPGLTDATDRSGFAPHAMAASGAVAAGAGEGVEGSVPGQG